MKKYAELHSIRFFKKRTILRRSQRLATHVYSRDHTVQFQRLDRAMKFFERFVWRVHRNGSKTFESFWMTRDQIGIRVVDHRRDWRLMLRIGAEDGWR